MAPEQSGRQPPLPPSSHFSYPAKMPSPQIVLQMVGDVKFPPKHLNPIVEP